MLYRYRSRSTHSKPRALGLLLLTRRRTVAEHRRDARRASIVQLLSIVSGRALSGSRRFPSHLLMVVDLRGHLGARERRRTQRREALCFFWAFWKPCKSENSGA